LEKATQNNFNDLLISKPFFYKSPIATPSKTKHKPPISKYKPSGT